MKKFSTLILTFVGSLILVSSPVEASSGIEIDQAELAECLKRAAADNRQEDEVSRSMWMRASERSCIISQMRRASDCEEPDSCRRASQETKESCARRAAQALRSVISDYLNRDDVLDSDKDALVALDSDYQIVFNQCLRESGANSY